MSLLSKLFGNRSSGNVAPPTTVTYSPTDELLDEDHFWQIVERSKTRAGGDFQKQQDILKDELRRLSSQDLIRFQNRFRQLRGLANNWELWGAIYIIRGGCSDDSFNDFREWLIGQGREFYHNASKDPQTLINLDQDEMMELDMEGLGYVAPSVFQLKHGSEIPSLFKEQLEPSGVEWSEEGDDLKRMFPELCEKFTKYM